MNQNWQSGMGLYVSKILPDFSKAKGPNMFMGLIYLQLSSIGVLLINQIRVTGEPNPWSVGYVCLLFTVAIIMFYVREDLYQDQLNGNAVDKKTLNVLKNEIAELKNKLRKQEVK